MTVPRGQLWDYPLFGLPYNGLAENEVITLPNGHTVDYPFSGHWAVYVQGRNLGRRAPLTAAQKAFQRQQGYRFRDYALLTGMYREIGGVQLGPQSWLYCDEDHTWQVRLDLARISGTNRFHAKLVLVNVFGLLEWDGTPPTMTEERVLAEIVFPLRYRYIEARETSCDCGQYLFMTHSRHGDLSVINMCVSEDEVGDCDFQMGTFGYQYGGNGYQTHTVIQARVSGKGSINAGYVGRGIQGSLEILAQGSDLVEGPSEGGVEGYIDYHLFAAVTKDGGIVWLDIHGEWSTGHSLWTVAFGGVELRAEQNAGPAVSVAAFMLAPNVFALQTGASGVVAQRIVVAADGHSLAGYLDSPGGSARLVAYNPGTGEFAVAPTSSDVVQWV